MRRKRGLVLATLAGLSVTLVVAAVSGTHVWRGFEERAQAVLLSRRGPVPWNPQVVILDIDEAALRRHRPVPRALLARIVRALSAAGARSLTFDVLYQGRAEDGDAADQQFAEALRESDRAVLMFDCSNLRIGSDAVDAAAFDASAAPLAARAGLQCNSVVLPHGPLHDGARLAQVMLAPSESGYIRGVYAFGEYGGRRLPSLGIAGYARANGIAANGIRDERGALAVGNRRLVVDDRGTVLVTHRGFPASAVVPLLEVEDALGDGAQLPESLARRFRDRYVLVGTSAPTLADLGPVATGVIEPFVAVHAAMISDLIEGRSPREAPAWVRFGAVVLAGLVMTGAALRFSPRNATLALVGTLLATVNVAWELAQRDVLFTPVAPMTAAAFAFGAALAARLSANEKERQLLTNAFGSYVHPDVLRRILENPDGLLSLEGARRQVTVLFSDIAGYTRLSNEAPEVVLGLLREYLATMTSLVTRSGGRVDKIMGDGLMAVFGDPIAAPDHARRAVEAAVAMQSEVRRLSAHWRAQGREGLSIRIGIATGEVFVGNIGAPGAKIEYTVLGPTVNLASRLEGKAPVGGSLVSKETRLGCGDAFAFEAVAGLALKGFDGDYEAYRVLEGAERAGGQLTG